MSTTLIRVKGRIWTTGDVSQKAVLYQLSYLNVNL